MQSGESQVTHRFLKVFSNAFVKNSMLLFDDICEFQGGVNSSEASHAGNGQELRWADRGQDALVKTGWKKMLHCPNTKRVHND